MKLSARLAAERCWGYRGLRVVETWKEETDQVLEILTEKMKHAADLKVSLEVEAHTGDTWFDAK